MASADDQPLTHEYRRPPDRKFHMVWLCLSAGVVLLSMLMEVRNSQQVTIPFTQIPLPELCSFRRLTGMDCAGCGMTRCFISLGHGDVPGAWNYNPAGILLYGIVLFQIPFRAWQLWRIRRGQPEVQPLLLVHGFPLDQTMWRAQVSELSKSCRVLAPDLRGFGQSSPIAGDDAVVTMAQFADDLAALLSALQVKEPVTFCGLSMGGYIAWQFAARHADKLGRLILCDTKAAADTKEGAEGRHKLAAKVLAEGSQAAADAMLPKLFSKRSLESKAPCVEETQQVILRTKPQTIAAALRGMAAREDFTSRLGGISARTLVLCGAEDVITPPSEMRTVAAAIPGAEYAEIPAAGHMTPLEDPQGVTQAIRKFLGS